MNPRTRRAALYAIAGIAIAASANALAHSYAGLYAWAVHHRLTGWQAMTWPAEIDVFLAVGELALYVAYLDGWPTRQRIWPWATALIGLVVSVAGNVGHVQPLPRHPVLFSDRLTAAASPLAAFAGLTVGLLVLRMNRQRSAPLAQAVAGLGQLVPLPRTATNGNGRVPAAANGDAALLQDAAAIYKTATATGERLSQRKLAQSLRHHGHRFPNQSLHAIAKAIGLGPDAGPAPDQ